MRIESLLPGIVGGLIGFSGALILSVIVRWRDDEKSRSETRLVLNIFLSELEHRNGILLNKYAEVDLSNDPVTGDIVKKINRRSSGVTFDYITELKPYRGAFDGLNDKLGSVGAELAVALWRHYTTMDERLLAHDNEMDALGGDVDNADKIRSDIRSETKGLIEKLKSEVRRKSKRAFVTWLVLWIVGKS